MEWIVGLNRAINYIEEHITEELDYETIAGESFSSSAHFQRVFSFVSGYTLGEYIRSRRLSLAGAELAAGNAKVIDVALKYGYESPDSFARAFQRFHGITPSQARGNGQMLKSFSRLSVRVSLEGGSMKDHIDCRIEEKPEMILTGYKRRFCGSPAKRFEQETDFYVSTRVNQYILKGLAHDCDTQYSVLTNFGEEGYDYYIASKIDSWCTFQLDRELGAEAAKCFEPVRIPAGLYLVGETARTKYPTMLYMELREKMIRDWLPASGYELTEGTEVMVIHWFWRYKDTEYNHSRYIEIWIPVKGKEK